MLKKICVVFLSVCVATAMVLGVHANYSNGNADSTTTLCIMDYDEVSC